MRHRAVNQPDNKGKPEIIKEENKTPEKKTENSMSIGIIPHTLDNTNLKNLKINDLVNLEFDIIAKYIENMLKEKSTKKINKYYLG